MRAVWLKRPNCWWVFGLFLFSFLGTAWGIDWGSLDELVISFRMVGYEVVNLFRLLFSIR